MKLSGLFKVSMVASALTLAGCGGDINITPTTVDNSVDNSVTNPGGFGSITSNPIINQPQVAILGICAVVKRPVVIDDMIGVRPMVMISLTFDHRVVDGEGGARYLASLKHCLENYEESPK